MFSVFLKIPDQNFDHVQACLIPKAAAINRKHIGELSHVLGLERHGRVNVAVQRDRDVSVAENLRKAFDVESCFYAPRSECVSCGMEVRMGYSRLFKDGMEAVLERSRFHEFLLVARKDERALYILFLEDIAKVLWDRDSADGTVAFWTEDLYSGFPVGISFYPDPLHRPTDRERSLIEIEVIPGKGADLAHTEPGKKTE